MITNNRIVFVQPTRTVGLSSEGDPIVEAAPGWHYNIDETGLTADIGAEPVAALRAAVATYIVDPATPQFSFGDERELVCLRFESEAEAMRVGGLAGMSDAPAEEGEPE